MKDPFVSVILPVYNADKFIASSIKSILDQTYQHFELIILNDGSLDKSHDVISSFKDKRIRYYRHDNAGMAVTLNRGIDLAKGELIARQDADDISYPHRFERQVRHLQANPSIILLGTHARIINEDGTSREIYHRHPVNDKALRFFLLFDNPFVHSSVMLVKSKLQEIGQYNVDKASLTQDYDLWSRMARKFAIGNLEEVLLDYRTVESGISITDVNNQSYKNKVVAQSIENIMHYGITHPHALLLAQTFHAWKEGYENKGNEIVVLCKVYEKLLRVFRTMPGANKEFLSLAKKVRYSVIKNTLYLYYDGLYSLISLCRPIRRILTK